MQKIPKNQQQQKLLELISNYSKVAEYKVNIQKSIVFPYTGSEQLKFDIKKYHIHQYQKNK